MRDDFILTLYSIKGDDNIYRNVWKLYKRNEEWSEYYQIKLI